LLLFARIRAGCRIRPIVGSLNNLVKSSDVKAGDGNGEIRGRQNRGRRNRQRFNRKQSNHPNSVNDPLVLGSETDLPPLNAPAPPPSR
ncbi:MAG: hypothetical protein AAB560_02780, partial [Patescibacteria group bacterium]